MAELTIRLRRDPATGKQDIVISMRSDEDALPHEHEQAHREAVEKILGKGNVGKVIIEREAEPEASATDQTPEPEEERRAGSISDG